MLEPKYNRIDYGEQLIPPDGYELELAIGTSYSLDLEVLLLIPVALFYSQKLDGEPDKFRCDIIDAITKSADKIKIYYQKGHLKVPNKYHHLMAYWENGIEAVTMPDHLSSFHPNVWIIRYKSKDNPDIYRLLITSRNLTFSRDWDIALATEGFIGEIEQKENKPLADFLNFLNSGGRYKIPDAFLKDLMRVKFDLPKNFNSLSFFPLGIKSLTNKAGNLNFLTPDNEKWDEMLIISPFLDKKTLEAISVSSSKSYLLSRKEEMDNIDEETLKKFECWQFSKFFQEAEHYEELSEENVLPLEQNLHAKLFIAMKDRIPNWFLGSANCSDAAQNRNIEFMAKLKGINTQGLRARDVLNLLTGKLRSDNVILFMPYDFSKRVSTEEQKRIDLEIRKIRYDISTIPIRGSAELIEGGSAYNLLIEIDARSLSMQQNYEIKIKPLPERQKASKTLKSGQINIIKDYTGYPETELSPFLIFEIYKDGEMLSHFLLQMEIELPDARLSKIISAIINSRDKFLKYLTFLLTGEEFAVLTDNSASGGNGQWEGIHQQWSISGTPVFEKLLIAASRYPDKLKSINRLIKSLKSETIDFEEPVITPEFEKFWQIFQNFIKVNERNR